MRYCTSVCFDTVEDTLKNISIASKKSDFIEIRLDKIYGMDQNPVLPYSDFIKAGANSILVLTNRNKKDGGNYPGEEKQRIEDLKAASQYNFNFVDIEFNSKKKNIEWIIKNKGKKKIILSYHNFKNTPANLENILHKMKNYQPDVIKICTFAKDINDNLKIFGLSEKIDPKQKIVIHAMGEKGEISRILGGIKYNYFTFTAPFERSESAPGQLTINKLNDIYKVERLKKNVKIFGLVGNPVKHSKGIIIHNHALNSLKINGIYVNFPVDNFNEFISGFNDYYSGLSITIPFKEKALKIVDLPDEKSVMIGAVNTVIKKNGKLFGYNTDYFGIKKSLEHINLNHKKIIIIGAGGAARSALAVLKEYNNSIFIINRTLDKAKKLSLEFNCDYCSMENLKDISFDLIINTTSVGMHPVMDSSPVDKQYLKNCVVFDMVYNPLETKLLREAKQNGCKTISGLKMFLFQAEEQFRLFTGKKYSFYENRKKIIKMI